MAAVWWSSTRSAATRARCRRWCCHTPWVDDCNWAFEVERHAQHERGKLVAVGAVPEERLEPRCHGFARGISIRRQVLPVSEDAGVNAIHGGIASENAHCSLAHLTHACGGATWEERGGGERGGRSTVGGAQWECSPLFPEGKRERRNISLKRKEEKLSRGDGWPTTRHRTRHASQALDQATRTGGTQLGSDGRLGCHCSICFAKIPRRQQLWRAYAHL